QDVEVLGHVLHLRVRREGEPEGDAHGHRAQVRAYTGHDEERPDREVRMRPAREEHLGRRHCRHRAERQPEDTPEETAATRPIHPSGPRLSLGDTVASVKTDGLGTVPVPRRTHLYGQLPTVWLLCPRSFRLAGPWGPSGTTRSEFTGH